MNYKIITDEEKLREFIDWLPELERNETFYVSLFARSKYCKGIAHIRSDKAQLKRFTSNKSRLFYKLKQLECEVGSYRQKDNPIPQEALAVYISPSPRDFERATKQSLKKFAELITTQYNGYNPHQEVMSEIQKARGRKLIMDFDFDIDKSQIEPTIHKVKEVLTDDMFDVIETRGGIHVLVKLDNITDDIKKIWYKHISSIDGADQAGDCMLPIVGTYQGGFTPKFIK